MSCDICRKDCDDPVDYGDICEKSNIKVHYYCLLLSTHLSQNGKEKGGILGFLIKDIKQEILNAKHRICYYCSENYASIKCSCCDVYFHLKCGLQNDCLFQFVDEFKSFCDKHHNIQHNNPHGANEGCYICRMRIRTYNPLKSITSHCCKTDGWVHRKCLKKYALAAGYYLKCLWCGKPEFRNYIRLRGIFVPDRDASWELIKGAYADFYTHLRRQCMAEKCICPKGRNFKNAKWNIVACNTCGAFAIHQACRRDSNNTTIFVCKTCKELEKVLFEGHFKFYEKSFKNEINSSLYVPKSQISSFAWTVGFSQRNISDVTLFNISSDSDIEDSEEEEKELNVQTVKNVQNNEENNETDEEPYIIYNENTLEICGFCKSPNTNISNENCQLVPEEYDEITNDFVKKLIEEHLENNNGIQTIVVSESDPDEPISKTIDELGKRDNIPVPKPIINNKPSQIYIN